MYRSENSGNIWSEPVHLPFLDSGDTVVAKDGTILEKPRDNEEAAEFLRELSDSAYHFVTSLTLVRSDTRRMLSTVETSEIRFRQLVDREVRNLHRQISGLEVRGRFRRRRGPPFLPTWVSGSFNFMTALPVSRLAVFLRDLGVEV